MTSYFLWISISLAQPLTPEQKVLVPWADERVTKDCNQACLYRRGNENLTMQMLYVLNKLEALKNIDEEKKKNELGDYCFSEGEDGNTCFKRYQAEMRGTLYRLRAGIISNKAMVTDLAARQKRGEIRMTFLPVLENLEAELQMGRIPNSKRLSQTTSVPTQAELVALIEATNKDLSRLNQLVSEEYVRWLEKLPHEPVESDFIQFREVFRDPSDPTSEKILIAKKDAKGKLLYDRPAFLRAKKKYDDDFNAALSVLNLPAQYLDDDKKRKSPRFRPSPSQLSKDAYKNAREAVVGASNDAISGKKESAGLDPTPASMAIDEEGEVSTSGEESKPVVNVQRSPLPPAYPKDSNDETIQLPGKPGGKDISVSIHPRSNEPKAGNPSPNPKGDEFIDEIENATR